MSSSFSDVATCYVAEKRALGHRFDKGEEMVRRIVRLHGSMGCPQDELPKELVEAFVAAKPGERESNRAQRVGAIRGLAHYMSRMGYRAYIVPDLAQTRSRDDYAPYIFSEEEIAALFAAADDWALEAPSNARGNYRQRALVLRLLYSTGMRIGEACALERGDVDLNEGVITIRESKNGKDRRVPLHPAMGSLLRSHVEECELDERYAAQPSFWLMPSETTMNVKSFYWFFRKVLWRAGISHGGKGRGPRVHDLRFTFACHRLRKWAEGGADIDSLLPKLATYMGHADTRCTEYYLRLTSEAYPGMMAQVEAECSWVVPEMVR